MKKLVAGILAHVDSGKTTLSEALLYETGVLKSLGRVDNKNAYLDNDAVERERGITIYSKNARIPLRDADTELILIDTPGHVDFSTEMERALSVLDIAILLVSGSSGVQSHTKTLWKLLKSYDIPTLIFVNKMDMEGADETAVLKDIKENLSGNAVSFKGDYYEDAATASEELLEEYLTDSKISDESIRKAFGRREIYPVFFGSALKMTGVSEFLEGLKYLTATSSPDGNTLKQEDLKSSDTNGPFSGIVYKITRDEKDKRLTFIKIISGSLKVKSLLGEEKINEIRLYNGENYESVTEVTKGDICAVVGLNDTKNGDVFGNIVRRIKAPILAPALSYAVHYPAEIRTNEMLEKLRLLEEEDPSLSVEYREQTKEIFVSLMGDVQTEVLKRTLKDRFDIVASFSDGKVCYKETIDSSFEGVGHFEPLRHYAEVHILLEPLERGSGMEFVSDISEDILLKNWQRLIYTHMTEREHRGVLVGAPITDMRLSLVSGRAHIKHTEGGDFRQATYRAIRQGLMELADKGNVHLLEPFYDYTLEIPSEYTGRAMTDINEMSGTCTIAETDTNSNITVLTGRAPVSLMNGYTKEVAAYSKGLGILSLSVSGYDLCHNEEEVLSKSTYDPEADLRNPTGSVFCSHGAGTVVPWYEVPEHMHLEYGIGLNGSKIGKDISFLRADADIRKEASALNAKRRQRENSDDIAISLEEIESILKKSTHANEKGRTGSYKGISEAVRQRRRTEFTSDNSETKYKGTKQKEKYILVDGYNLIHAWKELDDISLKSLDGAAGRLNDILCNYQAIEGVNLMVVYDAYRVKGHPVEENAYHNITVVYTREAQTADQYIERYAHDNSSKYDITVITSDGLEQIIVTGNGAHVISSREFQEILYRRTKEFNESHGVLRED